MKPQNTTETAKHTPTPWHFTEQLETEGQSIYVVSATDQDGDRWHDIRFLPYVSDWAEAHANAHFICQAVNQHDQLIAQRDALLEACKEMLPILPLYRNCCEHELLGATGYSAKELARILRKSHKP